MELVIYDGANTIGGNKIYLGDGKHGFFLDFGKNFVHEARYFREYISMRAIRGVHDPIEMGLLPRLDIYRRDLIPEDMRIESFNKLPLDAILITHAHLDHFGMAGYIDFSVPVVASAETLALIKSFQDTGQSNIATSVLYDAMRFSASRETSGKHWKNGYHDSFKMVDILRSSGRSMGSKENIKKNLLVRNIKSYDSIGDDLLEFLTRQSSQKKSDYVRDSMNHSTLDDLPFKVDAYPVDHSVYGATAYTVRVQNGNEDVCVAYTGDFRMHGDRGNKTREFSTAARGCDLLVVEGTRVSGSSHDAVSERDVLENSVEAVSNARGLVIADFSSSNFERLSAFSRIASDTGKCLVISARDAYAIQGLRAAGNDISSNNMCIYMKPRESHGWWMKYVMSGEWDDKWVSPLEIRSSPKNYLLAFSLFDMPNLMDIKPDGGLFLYSSTEAFNEDMRLDVQVLLNWLSRYNFEVVGLSLDGSSVSVQHGFHASGHASQEDIIDLVETISPELVIPVHTENSGWFSSNFENAKVLKNGEKLVY